MKEDLKFFKSFKKIEKGIENEGYVNWKENVESVLRQLDNDKLCNMHKRIQLSLKRCGKNMDAFNMIDALWVLSMSIVVSLFSIISEKITQEQAVVLIEVFAIGGMIVIVSFAGAIIRNIIRYDKKVDRELYYAELLDIIAGLIANKKNSDGGKRHFVVDIQETNTIISSETEMESCES